MSLFINCIEVLEILEELTLLLHFVLFLDDTPKVSLDVVNSLLQEEKLGESKIGLCSTLVM